MKIWDSDSVLMGWFCYKYIFFRTLKKICQDFFVLHTNIYCTVYSIYMQVKNDLRIIGVKNNKYKPEIQNLCCWFIEGPKHWLNCNFAQTRSRPLASSWVQAKSSVAPGGWINHEAVCPTCRTPAVTIKLWWNKKNPKKVEGRKTFFAFSSNCSEQVARWRFHRFSLCLFS